MYKATLNSGKEKPSRDEVILSTQEAYFIISLLLKRKRQILSAQAEVEDIDKALKTLRRYE